MESKEEILKIAFKTFMEEGFWEVSTNYLLEKMCIDKSVFSYYFKSKDQLICEAIDKFFFSALIIS